MRELVTQLLNALEYHQSQTRPIHNTELSIEAAREYLATEPKNVRQVDTLDVAGERAELIDRQRWVQEHGANPAMRALAKSTADMLEADAQQRSKPHGHCTHQKCREIWSAYLEATEKLSKYEPGATMHLNDAQQIKEMFEKDAA